MVDVSLWFNLVWGAILLPDFWGGGGRVSASTQLSSDEIGWDS